MDRVTVIAKDVCPQYGTTLCGECRASELGTCTVRTVIERLLQLGYTIEKPTKLTSLEIKCEPEPRDIQSAAMGGKVFVQRDNRVAIIRGGEQK